MRVVADTNTFLAVALDEPEKRQIIALTVGHDLLAPEVLPFEIGNALTAMMKKRTLDAGEMVSAWNAAQAIPVELRQVDMRGALRLAGRFKIYAYDAYFLECALSSRCPLLTLDQRLKVVARDAGVEILE